MVVVLCVSISFVALVFAATEPTSIRKTTTERALANQARQLFTIIGSML
ncbi:MULTISPECIES: hypothetical protein [Klebsiella pneumoniae complex]|nr:hypothetical protein [Klebsiella pneumoniae]MEB5845932.1 hypothetical protein [Klebsiella pneumoniae]